LLFSDLSCSFLSYFPKQINCRNAPFSPR
jgi:hypothetical protein